MSGKILFLWVKGGKAVTGENCFVLVEAVWVHACSTLLLSMTLSGFVFWEAWVNLCSGPVQTVSEREGKCVCVRGRMFACACLPAWIRTWDMVVSLPLRPPKQEWSSFELTSCISKSLSLAAVVSVLFVLWSWGEVERGLQVREPVAAARLRCFLLQYETKLGMLLSPRWPGNFVFSPGSLVPPTCAALFPPAAGESGWIMEPCGRGYGWMAQGCAQQPALMPCLVLQKAQELEWWNEEEGRLEFLYTCFVGALKLSRIPWFCMSFHVTLINSVPSSLVVNSCVSQEQVRAHIRMT